MRSVFEISESTAPNERLEMLSFETRSFLLNGGSLLIFFSLWLTALFLTSLLHRTALFCVSRMSRASRALSWIIRKLKWNIFFELIFASQMELLLASVIQVYS